MHYSAHNPFSDRDFFSYCTLYLVRHGQTDWNIEKKMLGRTDIPLNETGKKQAREMGKQFASIQFAAVFSSDLLRAKETADIIALEHSLTVITEKALVERDFGVWEGKPSDEYHAFADALGSQKSLTYAFETGESHLDVIKRLMLFLRATSVTYKGKNVLVVCHGTLLRALLVELGFASYEQLGHGAIKNTAYVKLLSDGVDFFISQTEGVTLTI